MKQFIDRAPEAKNVNLLAFVESLGYYPVSKKGDKAMFLSPLREEKSPSFSIYRYNGTWFWYDFGTGEKGDGIEFVKRLYGVGFPEALDILLGARIVESTSDNNTSEGPSDYYETGADKIEWVREQYCSAIKAGTLSGNPYFEGKQVQSYSSMGSCLNTFKWLKTERVNKYGKPVWEVDKVLPVHDTSEQGAYVIVPIPYPSRMRGLECRKLNDPSRRFTLGQKTLWVLKRDTSRILVAESYLDALAGEIIMKDNKMTLCALNGVGMVDQLKDLVKLYKPREVLLALDDDDPGREAQEKAIKIIRPFADITIINDHKMAGVKDLHKLLLNNKGSDKLQ